MSQFCCLLEVLKLWFENESPGMCWDRMEQLSTDSKNLLLTILDSRGLCLQHAQDSAFYSLLPLLAGFSIQMILWPFWETLIRTCGKNLIFSPYLINSTIEFSLSTCLWHFQVQLAQNPSMPQYCLSPALILSLLYLETPIHLSFPFSMWKLSLSTYLWRFKKYHPLYEALLPLLYRNARIILYIFLLEWLL